MRFQITWFAITRYGQGDRAVDEKSKESQRDRYLRAARKIVGHEEQKQRKADSAKRRAERGNTRRRQRDWDDDDAGTFEKIRRSRPTKAARGPSRSAHELAALPQAVVTAVHQGRMMLDNGMTARVAGHLLVDPTFRLAVGDEVHFDSPGGQARIEARIARRTCLSRPDPGNPHRALVIAANVDLAVIVVAAKDPPLRPGLIDRLLLAIGHGGAEAVICVNKIDLLATEREHEDLEHTLAPYDELGCTVFRCSAATGVGCGDLREHAAGHTCVFVGHSGVGKSSILNAMDPLGDRITGDVREHDGRGRHTTTSSTLRVLADGTRVIDTPGVRSFGLDVMAADHVRAGFAEFAPFALGCRFADCTHMHEPECAVQDAAANGALSPARYASYRRILEAL